MGYRDRVTNNWNYFEDFLIKYLPIKEIVIHYNTVDVENFAQYIFLRILPRKALDAKYN